MMMMMTKRGERPTGEREIKERREEGMRTHNKDRVVRRVSSASAMDRRVGKCIAQGVSVLQISLPSPLLLIPPSSSLGLDERIRRENEL
jgi:hypothetical protein